MKAAARQFYGHPTQLTVGLCHDCGKANYLTRREAKRAARAMFPGAHHRPFPCGQYWHIELVRGGSR
ncbi:hypothetical protein SCAB_60531 [Streptomyces scabiei 87.22]|uniref:Uncharacterized protein n=1 Tax=Streptomyces scabiei (strain 87.22) TaxID=680198 RepID=C9Z8Y3_STRSW|nr:MULTISPECIES: hypothetical protein [Streptomyces]MBP5875719.1 hypothetical protein [Streptomyces sp. LBUM 1477]MDX2652177.1 hypothetical protein [Streptomyces scabiei]MDX2725797.1 hypothetical protein [Streptomyces scabiei]MDX2863916.1 hypothetical protein [Streptomyces scabiei]MDX2881840.1 hypothetical protein [Streptomyces scabiei]